MPAQALAQRIINSLDELSVPSDLDISTRLNRLISREVTSYLLENCTVEVSFEATDDPETKILGSNPITGSVSPSESGGDPDAWLDSIGHNIALGFTTSQGIVKPLESHVSLSVPNDHLSKFIRSEEISTSPDPCLSWWTKFSDGIITMIESQISQPYPAATLDDVEGVATVTKLNIT